MQNVVSLLTPDDDDDDIFEPVFIRNPADLKAYVEDLIENRSKLVVTNDELAQAVIANCRFGAGFKQTKKSLSNMADLIRPGDYDDDEPYGEAYLAADDAQELLDAVDTLLAFPDRKFGAFPPERVAKLSPRDREHFRRLLLRKECRVLRFLNAYVDAAMPSSPADVTDHAAVTAPQSTAANGGRNARA